MSGAFLFDGALPVQVYRTRQAGKRRGANLTFNRDGSSGSGRPSPGVTTRRDSALPGEPSGKAGRSRTPGERATGRVGRGCVPFLATPLVPPSIDCSPDALG